MVRKYKDLIEYIFKQELKNIQERNVLNSLIVRDNIKKYVIIYKGRKKKSGSGPG